ncbi:MAG: fibronectin type III domain-containing protein [Candidatus Eisenbacteria bacterium]
MPFQAARDTDLRRTPTPNRPWRPTPVLAGALAALCLLAGAATARAQDSTAVALAPAILAPAPPSGVASADVPDDKGEALAVSWTASPDEAAHPGRVLIYRLLRADAETGPFVAVDSVAAGTTRKTDEHVKDGRTYWYRVAAVGLGGEAISADTGVGKPTAQWLNSTRLSVFLITILFFVFVLGYIHFAQRGRELFVRRIPGIDAIEEAIGRATEMGRSVLYVPGINDIDDIQTMASLTILESVAKMTARYETPIIVPTNYPVVFTLAQEMVKNGFVAAGRPDAYDPNAVRYVTTEQFAYVAAVNGIMLRDKPAANLYLGAFFAESLLLAETGFATKAIQVAGTAQVAQLPFFVVACDYTLIGEELYAASAYLSREPRLLGSLKGSDLMKVLLILIIVVGCALETAGIHAFTNFMNTQ